MERKKYNDMFSLKQFFEPTEQAPYENFQEYLQEDTLQVFKEDKQQEEPILIGEVPKIKRLVSDANSVKINITYPMTPLLHQIQQDYAIQLNGSDLYLTKKQAPTEDLYIPLNVYVYIDNEMVAMEQEKIPVAYGKTEVNYYLPCQRYAMRAVKTICAKHKEFIHHNGTNRLQLQDWQFQDGHLHVFTTLVPTLLGTLYMNGQKHSIRYVPQYTKVNDEIYLSISEEQLAYFVEMYAPKSKYISEVNVTYLNGVANIHIQATVNFEPYRHLTQPIDTFLAFLHAQNIEISDDVLYEYCLQQTVRMNHQKRLVMTDE